MEPYQVAVEDTIKYLISVLEGTVDVGGWEGCVEGETNVRIDVVFFKVVWRHHEVGIVYPDHVFFFLYLKEVLRKPPVDVTIIEPKLGV